MEWSNNSSGAEGNLVTRLGFRRITLVRLPDEHDATHALVEGVVHRAPRTVRVPIELARRLIASGVPAVHYHGTTATAAVR